MIGPAVPFLREEFRLDYGAAAMHMSAFALGQIVSGLLASPAIRRFGSRRALWGGMLGILVGITGLVLSPAAAVPAASLASIFVMSLAGTVSLSVAQASIAGLSGERRGQALMEANMTASVTSAASPFVLVAGLALGIGWRALWPAFALALALTAILGFKPVARELPDRPESEADAESRGARLPAAFIGAFALIFVGVGVEWSAGFWATEYMKGLPGGSMGLAAAGAGVFQIAAVCGRFLSSRLMARVKERTILLGAMGLVLAGFPLYWARLSAVSAFIGLALCGFGVSTFYPLCLSLALAASGGLVSKASSLAAVSAGAAIFAVPLLLGLVADGSGLSTALWAIPIGLGAMAVLLFLGRRGGRARAAA
jgi:fucose permease